MADFLGSLNSNTNYISRTIFFLSNYLTELEWDLILIPKTLLYCWLLLSFPNSQRTEQNAKAGESFTLSLFLFPSLLPYFLKDILLAILALERDWFYASLLLFEHGLYRLALHWYSCRARNLRSAKNRIFIFLYLILTNKTSPTCYITVNMQLWRADYMKAKCYFLTLL